METPLQPRVEKAHDWQELAVGRICRVCLLVEAKDEYDEHSRCPPERPPQTSHHEHAFKH